MIDFELYRIFVEVAKEGNITKASEKLNVSQPAITKKIKNEAVRATWKGIKNLRSSLETLAKNVPELIIAIPRATLTIALIPPILKYVFGVEKKKKPEPQKETNNMTTPSSMDFINKPVFQEVKGGVK